MKARKIQRKGIKKAKMFREIKAGIKEVRGGKEVSEKRKEKEKEKRRKEKAKGKRCTRSNLAMACLPSDDFWGHVFNGTTERVGPLFLLTQEKTCLYRYP